MIVKLNDIVELKVSSKTSEGCILVSYGCVSFLYSCRFLSNTLDKTTNSLTHIIHKTVKIFGNQLLDEYIMLIKFRESEDLF